jgi:hypothetical protein
MVQCGVVCVVLWCGLCVFCVVQCFVVGWGGVGWRVCYVVPYGWHGAAMCTVVLRCAMCGVVWCMMQCSVFFEVCGVLFSGSSVVWCTDVLLCFVV